MACIVIADDDVDIAEFISYSFQAAGHSVHTALDGASALALVRRHLPDLTVLDHMMPGLTGLQVAEAMRAGPLTAHTPILLITGSEVGEQAALVDRVVHKPLRPRQLAAIMTDMLAHATSGDR